MFDFIKKKVFEGTEKVFNAELRIARVTLYKELSVEYGKEFDIETAKVLAARVVNYLTGEDTTNISPDTEPSIAEKILQINPLVEKYALAKMDNDRDTRELIVSTLRMKTVIQFSQLGRPYLESDEKKRIEKILVKYGVEFPEEIKPNKYSSIVSVYHEKRFIKT